MKPKATIALAVATAMFAGIASAQDKAPAAPADQPKKEETPVVSPEQMKKDISFFLGFQNGMQMKQIPTLTFDDIDTEAYMSGIKDGLSATQPPANQEALQKSVDAFQDVINKRVAELSKTNLEKSKKFMEENGKKEGVVTTKSGLQYKVEKPGGDKKYDEKDYKNPLFTIKYKGTKTDGTVFDETKDQAVDMPLQVIPGFAEALKSMPVGSKWVVFIPAELAYGEQSPGAVIGPNEPLIFELELEGIKEAPQQPGAGGMKMTPEQLQQLLQQSQGGEG